MKEAVVAFVSGFPDWLATIILAAVPITELQLAIPFAMHKLDMAWWAALLLSFVGNALPFLPLYFGLEKLRAIVETHFPWFLGPLDAFIRRAERKLGPDYERLGAAALFFFIWIPFPFTGLWTATAAAVALKIDFKEAAIGVLGGMMSSGIIVLIISAVAGSV